MPDTEDSTDSAIDMAKLARHRNISQRQPLRSEALMMQCHLPPMMMPNESMPMIDKRPRPA